MRVLKGIAILAASVVLTACDNGPGRFGGGGGGGLGQGPVDGLASGSIDDPTSPAFFEEVVGDPDTLDA